MKKMLSVDELIEHMKAKGITFNEMSEQEAKAFLSQNNYYMKLAAYRANYEKCLVGKRIGQYKKLDFGYLKELSTIDMYLRYKIIDMCLDIEHVIKVRLVDDAANNPNEDGYDIVRKFISKDDNLRILKKIRSHKSGEYCKDLIEKYYPYFPVWVFVELISFGDLLYFCSFYEETYGVQIINNTLMNTVRDLRNAAAHSNCLLNKMTEKIDSTKQVNSDISNFIKYMPDISKTSRVNNLNCKFTNNFITLLYVYDCLMSNDSKKKRYTELQEFLNGRVIRHKEYFQSNSKVVGVYKLLT
jgi:abortive infection bacteriophage resistance protein